MKTVTIKSMLLAGVVFALSNSAVAGIPIKAAQEMVDGVFPFLNARCSSGHLHAFIQRDLPMMIPIWDQDEPVKCEADGSFSANGNHLSNKHVSQLFQNAINQEDR